MAMLFLRGTVGYSSHVLNHIDTIAMLLVHANTKRQFEKIGTKYKSDNSS